MPISDLILVTPSPKPKLWSFINIMLYINGWFLKCTIYIPKINSYVDNDMQSHTDFQFYFTFFWMKKTKIEQTELVKCIWLGFRQLNSPASVAHICFGSKCVNHFDGGRAGGWSVGRLVWSILNCSHQIIHRARAFWSAA